MADSRTEEVLLYTCMDPDAVRLPVLAVSSRLSSEGEVQAALKSLRATGNPARRGHSSSHDTLQRDNLGGFKKDSAARSPRKGDNSPRSGFGQSPFLQRTTTKKASRPQVMNLAAGTMTRRVKNPLHATILRLDDNVGKIEQRKTKPKPRRIKREFSSAHRLSQPCGPGYTIRTSEDGQGCLDSSVFYPPNGSNAGRQTIGVDSDDGLDYLLNSDLESDDMEDADIDHARDQS